MGNNSNFDTTPVSQTAYGKLVLCFGLSIGLHLVLFATFMYTPVTPESGNRTHFIEMRDFVPAPTHSSALVTPAAIDSLANANPPSDPPDSFRPPDTTALNPDATIMNGVLETKLGRGVAYGYVSSLADGATLQAGVREYYLELVEKINAIWWERAGMLSEAPRQDGTVEIVVLRDGTLAARRMIRGTGSREVDRALIESIDRAAPFSRLPADFLPNVFFAPIKITAPSRLLRIMRQ